MRATRQLPGHYRPDSQLNLADRRRTIAMNLVGLLLLLLFGWLFFQLARLTRPDYANLFPLTLLSGVNWLSLFLTIILVTTFHELVHGLFFWLFSRARPQFGLTLLSAYAAAPGWYFPRHQFALIGLAPFFVLTMIALAFLPIVPLAWSRLLWVGLTMNGAGAIGDFWVVVWLLARPEHSLIYDGGTLMTAYRDVRPELEAKWLALGQAVGLSRPELTQIFTRLCHHYTTPNRHYHNLVHIWQVLTHLEQLPTANNSALYLAAWFHDLIYDPQANDNEAQSATYACQWLAQAGCPAGLLIEIERLILLTKSHQTTPDDIAGCWLIEADLSILATRPDSYDAYAAAIRQEYNWVSEADYRAGRAQFLRGLLQRESLFCSGRGQETQARQNLTRELSQLTTSPTLHSTKSGNFSNVNQQCQ